MYMSRQSFVRRIRSAVRMASTAFLCFCATANAQELELRRWNHLPVDRSFGTVAVTDTQGDINFDPALQIQDAEVSLHGIMFGYIRTFDLMGRTARVEVRQGWQQGNWDGIVGGAPVSIDREGMSDTILRFALNLAGAPPLAGKAYADYRRSRQRETIVGVALGVQIPTGSYYDDKLINLGSNRFTFRPQIGMQHKLGNWTFEITGTALYYTDNTSFFNGGRLEQGPYYSLDGSIEYSSSSGWWVAVDGGVGVGGETVVNGVMNNDSKHDYGWSISAGYPLSPQLGLKASYTTTDHAEDAGTASRNVSVGLLATW